jgi:hypothetical protein
VFLAWRAEDTVARWFFVGCGVLNLVGGLVAVDGGDAWKWMPDDGVFD